MSDQQLAIETISQLPDDPSMEEISRRLEFLAAVHKGLDQIERQIERGETVPHDEVKRQLASCLSK